jgi:hypothetical protein
MAGQKKTMELRRGDEILRLEAIPAPPVFDQESPPTPVWPPLDYL